MHQEIDDELLIATEKLKENYFVMHKKYMLLDYDDEEVIFKCPEMWLNSDGEMVDLANLILKACQKNPELSLALGPNTLKLISSWKRIIPELCWVHGYLTCLIHNEEAGFDIEVEL